RGLLRKERTMPNVCSYGVTAAGPQQAVVKCYELLKVHLIDKDNAYGKYILDDEAMVGSESGQVVGVNELSLKEGSLGLYGSSSYCPPAITKYLAFAFPELTFTVKGDTEYGDVVERWEVTAQGTRCLDMGSYDREEN